MQPSISRALAHRLLLAVSPIGAIACGGGDEAVPDGVWNVTVESLISEQQTIESSCLPDGGTVYSKSFKYELYYDGEVVQIDINGQSFAEGTRAGCNLLYESSVWLDERPGGQITWYVEGGATYQGAAGGCDNQLSEGLDWVGYEVAIVVESEDESVPVGCEYDLVTTGSVVSGG